MFPTYPIVLGFKGDAPSVASFPSPAMGEGNVTPALPGTRTGLDGERYIEFLQPLPLDGNLFLTNKLNSVSAKGKGASVEQESLITDGTGKQYVRMISASFLLGSKNFKGAGKSIMPNRARPDRKPDAEVTYQTSPKQTHIYRLSGDYNPLHIDPNFATMFGFKEPILHGLCSLGFVARAVLATYCNNEPSGLKAFKVRFASPVIPGEALIISMWRDGAFVLIEAAVNRGGKREVVISNAFAELHQPKAKL
jgi:3-hydroxyacyl-CoA dehydrogenase/3a,7a,12a-trihydroxy-5b-cholest-24-enoyl-CoA hydratase